jgi:thiamine-monophosphate kinase
MDATLRAATCGDDYEILFTAPRDREGEILSIAKETATPVTRIGHVKPGTGVVLLDENARKIPVARPGYRHF